MEPLVGPAQFFERGLEESLVLDFLSRAQGRQAVQPHIDAHRRRFFHWHGVRDLDLDAHKPPICRLGNARPCHLADKAEILGHIHPSELRHPKAVITQLKLIVRQIEARLTAFLALELGAVRLALKKGGKRLAQIEKGLVRGVLGDFPGPGELLAPDGVELLLER